MIRASLADLATFTVIARHQSFRAAARELGVSPSALSHAMRALEERLGVRLLNRTTRSVSLTESGELLLRRAVPAISDLEAAVDEVITARDRPSGTVRISAAESCAAPLIKHVLPDFLAKHPDIHVEFVVDTRYVDIVADGFDAGIRLLEDVPRDMVAIAMGPRMRFAAVASPVYLAKHKVPKQPQDLQRHKCIRFRFASGALYHWDLQSRGRTFTLDAQGPMTLGNTNLMIEAALAGIGVAWVPLASAAKHLNAGRLVHVLPQWGPSLTPLALYYPASRHQPVAFKLFCDAVREWADSLPREGEPLL